MRFDAFGLISDPSVPVHDSPGGFSCQSFLALGSSTALVEGAHILDRIFTCFLATKEGFMDFSSRMRAANKLLFLLVLSSIGGAAPAMAQLGTGSVVGVISDSQGAVVDRKSVV